MDQPGTDRHFLLEDIRSHLDESCIDFSLLDEGGEILENLAMCDEQVLEEYLETGRIPEREICRMVRERKVFPCYFGSALKLQGVEELLKGLERWLTPLVYGT